MSGGFHFIDTPSDDEGAGIFEILADEVELQVMAVRPVFDNPLIKLAGTLGVKLLIDSARAILDVVDSKASNGTTDSEELEADVTNAITVLYQALIAARKDAAEQIASNLPGPLRPGGLQIIELEGLEDIRDVLRMVG